jgi:hypothetical protein
MECACKISNFHRDRQQVIRKIRDLKETCPRTPRMAVGSIRSDLMGDMKAYFYFEPFKGKFVNVTLCDGLNDPFFLVEFADPKEFTQEEMGEVLGFIFSVIAGIEDYKF